MKKLGIFAPIALALVLVLALVVTACTATVTVGGNTNTTGFASNVGWTPLSRHIFKKISVIDFIYQASQT